MLYSNFCVYRGANTEVQDINSYTPFLLAAANGHLEVVAELKAKTQIDKLDKDRKSAVFLAAEGGYLPVLKVLSLSVQLHHCCRGIFHTKSFVTKNPYDLKQMILYYNNIIPIHWLDEESN